MVRATQKNLAAQKAATRGKITALNRHLAMLESQQRALDKRARKERQQRLGALVEEAGLADADPALLREALAALAALMRNPDFAVELATKATGEIFIRDEIWDALKPNESYSALMQHLRSRYPSNAVTDVVQS